MKWGILLRWVVVLVVATAAPSSAGTVRGLVRDAATLNPLDQASVTMHILDPDSTFISTQSDLDGSYVISGIPSGNGVYALICSRAGYAGYYARLQDPGDSDVTFHVFLEQEQPPPPPPPGDPDSSEVSGRILGAGDGSLWPIAGAIVTLRADGSEYVGYTDRSGRFDLVVTTGVYSVRVDAEGFTSVTDSGVEAVPAGLTYNAYLNPSTADVPDPNSVSIALRSAGPNPFQRATTLTYALAEAGHVELSVHDILGRNVGTLVSGWMPAGIHTVEFAPRGLPGGVYFGVLRAGGQVAMLRMARVR